MNDVYKNVWYTTNDHRSDGRTSNRTVRRNTGSHSGIHPGLALNCAGATDEGAGGAGSLADSLIDPYAMHLLIPTAAEYRNSAVNRISMVPDGRYRSLNCDLSDSTFNLIKKRCADTVCVDVESPPPVRNTRGRECSAPPLILHNNG